jgi:hypothetical protein
VAPYNYVVRPLAHFIRTNWLPTVLSFIFFVSLGVLIIKGTPWMLTIPIVVGLGTALIGIIAYNLSTWWSNRSIDNGAITHAKMHDPSCLRNSCMNLYNPENKVTLALTCKEFDTYHRVIGLLNKKEYMVPCESSIVLTEPSSSEFLGESCIPDPNKNILINPVKAKAVLIKKVLNLEQQLGMSNQFELAKAVEHEYKQYHLGKQFC